MRSGSAPGASGSSGSSGTSSPTTSQSGTAPGSPLAAAARKPPHAAWLTRMPPSQVRCTATSGGASAPSAFWNPTPQAGSIAIASSSATSGANTIAAASRAAPIL